MNQAPRPMAPLAPVIPPPPPRVGPRRKPVSLRLALWPLAFLVGAALGIGAYRLGVVAYYFDYWLALLG